MSSTSVVDTSRYYVAASTIICVILALVPASISAGLTYSGGNNMDPLGPLTQCTMSEYACTNRKCISMNKFCDNQNDCGDGSDEPRFCTPCNRTYYGNVGLTYQLELHRPKEDKIPYVCILTFMASGGLHGDIVQVTIDSFTLGKFVSYTTDGCPDGYLQISESSRTPVGGMWCGTSWGPVMFFSETRSLILAVKLWRLSRDQNGYNFDFRVHYKVLPRENAVVRYGGIKYEEIRSWSNYTNLQSAIHVLDEFTNSTAYSEELGVDNTVNSFNSNNLFYDKDNNNNNSKDKDRIMDKDRQISLINSNKYSVTNSTSYGIQSNNLSSSSNGTHPNFIVPKYYLGDLIQGTYCSRIFSDCDKKTCRLQSPNFPGIYPRNLTCYYAIRQHEVPLGKHALIIVRQPKGNLVWISTQTILNTKNDKEKFVPTINTWDECDNVQDYITVYDGYTTRDPVILKFCGGGQSVPSSISSGPELLVEFTTSPYGTFITQQSSVQSLHGFQLEVEVKFVDQQSPTYAKSKRNCEFWLTGTGHGVLESPKHSLPPNTTCLYHLHGTEGSFRPLDQIQIPRRMSSTTYTQPVTRFRIWISILKFNFASQFGLIEENLGIMQPTEDCTGMLRIWDGPLREPPICKDVNCERDINNKPIMVKYGQNYTNVLARFCRGTVPKSCDHGLLNETKSRPCLMSESFLSSSDFVTLELKNIESTVLRPLNFKLRYEFIDLLQDGLPIDSEHECNRRFASSLIERRDPGVVRSVRNVFLFGRGGATDLKCVYRFEGQRGERVRLVIRKIMTGNRTCGSKIDADINRSYCFGDNTIKLEIFEHPFSDSILFPRGCVCNSSINGQAHAPVIYMSTSREVEIQFTAINMTALDDPDSVNFEATYEFFKGPTTCRDSRRKSGSSGIVDLSVGDLECRTRPWLIEPNNGKSLYVRLNGLYLRRYNPLVQVPLNTSIRMASPTRCTTTARVVITTGEGIQITACPLNAEESTRHFIEVFSAGWNRKVDYEAKEPAQIISVEFLEPDDGDFQFTWLELTKMPPKGLLGATEQCLYKCPELDACINASVWCDGKSHCPSGYDESFTHCSALLRLPPEILATICAFIVLLCCGIIGFIFRKIKRKCRRSSVLQTRLKSLSSMDTAVFDEKDIIC